MMYQAAIPLANQEKTASTNTTLKSQPIASAPRSERALLSTASHGTRPTQPSSTQGHTTRQ